MSKLIERHSDCWSAYASTYRVNNVTYVKSKVYYKDTLVLDLRNIVVDVDNKVLDYSNIEDTFISEEDETPAVKMLVKESKYEWTELFTRAYREFHKVMEEFVKEVGFDKVHSDGNSQ